jgi:DNA polymerase-3 subunit gamma/tau
VIKTADRAGITMLSGVASDQEVLSLTKQLSSGELVRMMNRIQTTLQGFTRSSSRRMDAELCLIELCQPELNLDAQAINARLTRLEDQLRSGELVLAKPKKPAGEECVPVQEEEDRPPMPDDSDVPPAADDPAVMENTPVGFMSDLFAAVKKEVKPPASGFFTVSASGALQGALMGDRLELRCSNSFTMDTINKPDILAIVSRKASAMLGRPITVHVADASAARGDNRKMEQLLQFGRAHSNIVNIKNN